MFADIQQNVNIETKKRHLKKINSGVCSKSIFNPHYFSKIQ